ncbi:MAG TPA: nuclear transport factor 2 family protein, partial [Kofleriaceae bacterium]|nr:nuclear transport factor 2 family protein [Kofleriaceae bacterium]
YLACIAAFNERDEAALAACYTDDANLQLADSGEPMVGGAAVVASNVAVWTAMPDMRQVPLITIVAGDRVGALLQVFGTHTGPLATPAGELAPTQARTGSFGIELADFTAAGTVLGATQVWDTGLLLRQLQQAPDTRAPLAASDASPRVLRSQDTPAERANLELARGLVTAISSGDLGGATRSLDAESTAQATALADDVVGATAIAAQLTALRRAFPNLTVELGDALAADDHVIGTLKVTGTHAATKKTLALTAGLALAIADGVIRRAWLVTNGVAVMTQLGLPN